MKRVLKFPIMAEHSADQIIVYQAFSDEIGKAAAKAGTLDVPAFSKTRMTWIKPSYLWMMYRCGWGRKDAGQSTILRISMTRDGFATILDHACLSSFDGGLYASRDEWKADLAAYPNRVQWDPDKDLHLQPIERRAIQIGIAAAFVPLYLDRAITGIEDITDEAQEIEAMVKSSNHDLAAKRIPQMTEIPDDWLATGKEA